MVDCKHGMLQSLASIKQLTLFCKSWIWIKDLHWQFVNSQLSDSICFFASDSSQFLNYCSGTQPQRHSAVAVDLRRVSARDKTGSRKSQEGVPVRGVFKCGKVYNIARWGVKVFGRNVNNVLRDFNLSSEWGQCVTGHSAKRLRTNCALHGTCSVHTVRRLPRKWISCKRNDISEQRRICFLLFNPRWWLRRIPSKLTSNYCSLAIVKTKKNESSKKGIIAILRNIQVENRDFSRLLNCWSSRCLTCCSGWGVFVPTSNECCMFMIQSFACLLRFLSPMALVHLFFVQRKFPWFFVSDFFLSM